MTLSEIKERMKGWSRSHEVYGDKLTQIDKDMGWLLLMIEKMKNELEFYANDDFYEAHGQGRDIQVDNGLPGFS